MGKLCKNLRKYLRKSQHEFLENSGRNTENNSGNRKKKQLPPSEILGKSLGEIMRTCLDENPGATRGEILRGTLEEILGNPLEGNLERITVGNQERMSEDFQKRRK